MNKTSETLKIKSLKYLIREKESYTSCSTVTTTQPNEYCQLISPSVNQARGGRQYIVKSEAKANIATENELLTGW